MPERSEYFHFLKELFPGAGSELLQLLQGAAENAFLLRSDDVGILDLGVRSKIPFDRQGFERTM